MEVLYQKLSLLHVPQIPWRNTHLWITLFQIIGQAVDNTTTMFAFKFLVVKQFFHFPMRCADGRT